MLKVWGKRSVEKMDSEARACRDCKWYSGGSKSVCVCDNSDRLSDFVTPAENCPEWEEKDGQGND